MEHESNEDKEVLIQKKQPVPIIKAVENNHSSQKKQEISLDK